MTKQEVLLRWMQVQDALFPAGAFTLSDGLETYTQKGLIEDSAGLEAYINTLIDFLPSGDLGFLCHGMRAEHSEEFIFLDQLYLASRSAKEMRLGSQRMCRAFFRVAGSFYGEKGLYHDLWEQGRCKGCYPLALADYAKSIEIDAETAALMVGYSKISVVVNHGVKLIPLGQSQGQGILNRALSRIAFAAQKACSMPLEELGTSGPGLEIRAMQHQELYSRLYMS